MANTETTSNSPPSSDIDDVPLNASDLLTPISMKSGYTSPMTEELPTPEPAAVAQKKKKKKKPKKSAKSKDATDKPKFSEVTEGRPPVLCISRNKHWRYISSYHVCSIRYTIKPLTEIDRVPGSNSPSNC